ncbi:MAG: transposase [Methanobrevibacter sp.]|nr:transposase [Methanobrevibacter sp.]
MSSIIDENNYYGGEQDVTEAVRIRLYPTREQKKKINQNIGNRGFIWNKMLGKIKYENVKPTQKNLNKILNELKIEYSFLEKSESSSRQQVFIDLIKAYNKHKKEKNVGFPKFKSEENPNISFRIQANNNNIRLNERKNRIQVPTIGKIKFKTSEEHKQKIQESKINNMTIKLENGIYYGILNLNTKFKPMKHKYRAVGIDIGIRRPLTCSDGLKIEELDLTKEEQNIKYYQREMSKKEPGSRRYLIAQQKYGKAMNRKINKKNDQYHKITRNIVKNNQVIALETLSIKGWFKNKRWAPKLQKISLYEIMRQLKYKSERNNRKLIQVGRFFPSSQKCSNCGYQYFDLRLGEEEWICPQCGKHHDRDLNASINIKNEGLRLILDEIIKTIPDRYCHGLRCAGIGSKVLTFHSC